MQGTVFPVYTQKVTDTAKCISAAGAAAQQSEGGHTLKLCTMFHLASFLYLITDFGFWQVMKAMCVVDLVFGLKCLKMRDFSEDSELCYLLPECT